MSLDACSLSFSYPCGRMLFSDVSFSIRAGECVALTAPSGTGKTTLCRILAGYLEPRSGSVVVDGEPLCMRGHRALPVQLLWQHPEQAFDHRLRMGRSLAEVGDVGDKFALQLMDSFGIRSSWLARFPRELSGGELMRFSMVRALMTHPRYLIADEATAMLDACTQAELWGVLLHFVRRGDLGMIAVSHSANLIERIATRSIEIQRAS